MQKPAQLSLWTTESKEREKQVLDWSFKGADTQYLTHGLHPYPARMIPQIASCLMDMYLNEHREAIVTDVFCGSGTVNVEASLKGFKSFGIDTNPFAVLLATAKVTQIDNIQRLNNLRERINRKITAYRHGFPELVPQYQNIEHWFKKAAIEKLSYLKHAVISERSADLKNLLWIAFANTLMKASNVDWKSSRYIRVKPKEDLEFHNPRVFHDFQYYLRDLQSRIRLYSLKKKAEATILRGDARELPFKDNSVDIIITSPPYGEERNTIPYVRWSKLFLLWLGLASADIASLERQALGGDSKSKIVKEDIPSETFWISIESVSSERVNEALPFMKDYVITLREMYRVLRPEARCCIVIGHRSIRRNLIDMGRITQEISPYVGFKLENIFQRSIPKKMIPWSTPTGQTIFDESIVILRKLK